MAGRGVVRAGGRWRVLAAATLLLALLVTALGAPTPALAATRTVTNGNDGGAGSLRQTIADANAGDTIVFAPGVATVMLTSAALTLSKNVTIQGSGQGGVTVYRSGAGTPPNFRIFRVASGVSATLQGLSILGGTGELFNGSKVGGGIFTQGTLTLSDSIVRSNFTDIGGGIFAFSAGTTTLSNSVVSGNSASVGGGLYAASSGTVTLTNSTVSGNTASDSGGGIFLFGTLVVSKSTINNNVATNNGGGVALNSGTATLTNSTLSGNTAAKTGGGVYASGAVTLTGSTVTSNATAGNTGGGIFVASGTTTATGSLVVGNTGGDCGGGPGLTVTSGGYNVVGSGTGCASSGTGDLAYAGALAALLDPALAFNGGPTRTHALPSGSPAIGRLPAAQCGAAGGVDQRGVARPQGSACDSGAFEAGGAGVPVWIVRSSADSGGNCSGADPNLDTSCTLRQALAVAAPGDTIAFASNVTEVTLTSGGLAITRNVTIRGSGQGGVTVRRSSAGGTPNFGVFRVAAGAGATLRGLTISGGAGTPYFDTNVGGGIFNEGLLTLVDSTVSGNTAQLGGGIYGELGSSLTVLSSAVSGNTAGVNVGGIVNVGPLMLVNSAVSGNTGGGISGGTLTLISSAANGNTGNTGGIRAKSVTLINSAANGNIGTSAGAIYAGSGSDGSTVTLVNSTVSDNRATDATGGIGAGTVTVTNSTVSGNTGTNGGIGAGTATVTGSIVSGNTGTFVGGIGADTLTVTGSTVSGNTGGEYGGGISAGNGTATVTNSTISGNTGTDGGGIYALFNDLTLTNSTVSGNTASNGGGGIYLYRSGTVTLTNSTLTGNAAGVGGGIMISDRAGSSGNPMAVTLNGSLVAGNAGGDCVNNAELGVFTSGGYNVFGSSGCLTNGTGDLAYAGALAALLDPALAFNGGPTRTHALPSGSPAIGRLPAAQCGATGGVDQRGVARPQGSACDSGAFEAGGAGVPVWIVRSSADSGGNCSGADPNPDTSCTLRQALAVAAPGDTITFAPGLTVVTLTSAELAVTKAVTIRGGGQRGVTVQRSFAGGTPAFRIFRVASGVDATLQGLTIRNGLVPNAASAGGGGILNEGGTLTLTDSAVTQNSSDGIAGGGLAVSSGTVMVARTLFYGNSAGYYDGTRFLLGGGGGIAVSGGVLTLTNTTLSGNQASGGPGGDLHNTGGQVALRFVTATDSPFASEPGGINAVSGTTTLASSLIAYNSAAKCLGAITSGGYNVVANGTNCPTGGPGDLAYAGAPAALLDPALAFNGGQTSTRALPPGSPAIDRVPAAQCGAASGVDQRGATRPQPSGGACDSGAYELIAAPVVTNGNDDGPGSLRQTLAFAFPGATITFAPDVATVTLTSDALTIEKHVTIQGRGRGGVTVQRSGASGTPDFPIFGTVDSTIANTTGTTLQGLTIRNGYEGIRMANGSDPLVLIDTIVRDNAVTGIDVGNGGGVSGPLTLLNSVVSGTTGDGISSEGSTLTLTNSTISGNSGAALSFNAGTVTVRFATITGNGGGIAVGNGGSLSLEGSIVAGNGGTNCAASAATSLGGNVVGNGTGCPANGPNDLAYVGSLAVLLNPTLAADGTHRLPAGSPALDRVLAASCGAANGTDQRGVARPQPGGGACDSGAVEMRRYTLTTGTAGTGTGIVTPVSAIVLEGGVVGVSASPTGGSTFVGWMVDGVPQGAANPLSVTMSDNRSIVATFAAPAAPTDVPLTVVIVGDGTVARDTPGTGGGPFGYAPGTVVKLTPQPAVGQTFVGWAVDGVNKGWAPSLTVTMDVVHAVEARFVATKTFADTGSVLPEYEAVVALATRGYILGLNAQQYGPAQGVQRAQMAALIDRATPAGPDTAPTVLAPPACIVAGTWDCDVWPNNFTDRDGLDGNLWRNIGALQHYGVTVGYTAADCASKGKTFPCFGPTNPVTYAETITFITRAMVAKGYWVLQPNAPQPYAGVPAVFAPFVATFTYYTTAVPAPPANWNTGATRGWFAQALWAALNSYWGTDGQLPDGRNAGGFAP